jgi:hypothetical protein
VQLKSSAQSQRPGLVRRLVHRTWRGLRGQQG